MSSNVRKYLIRYDGNDGMSYNKYIYCKYEHIWDGQKWCNEDGSSLNFDCLTDSEAFVIARCIDGYLYDLDDIDEEGHLLDIGIIPCPFCNKKEFVDWYGIDKYNRVVDWVKEHYPNFN